MTECLACGGYGHHYKECPTRQLIYDRAGTVQGIRSLFNRNFEQHVQSFNNALNNVAQNTVPGWGFVGSKRKQASPADVTEIT